MKKIIVIIFLLLIPVLLIASGLCFENEIFSSIGYVILIFYIIMALKARFSRNEKKNKQV